MNIDLKIIRIFETSSLAVSKKIQFINRMIVYIYFQDGNTAPIASTTSTLPKEKKRAMSEQVQCTDEIIITYIVQYHQAFPHFSENKKGIKGEQM